MLPSSSILFSSRWHVVAVATAFFVAAGFIQLDRTPRATLSAGTAGEAMMQLLRDEHATIAAYLKDEAQARTMADRSAALDMERMKVATLAEAQPAPQISRVHIAAKPARVVSRDVVTGEPMQLLAMTEVPTAPQPPHGFVRGKLRQFASTVERIPSWFNAAAGWVVEAMPVPHKPLLPMRHFRV
jgi:hypothetical protein